MQEVSKENPHIMKCVMRLVTVAQSDVSAVAAMLVGKLTEILSELCQVCSCCSCLPRACKSAPRLSRSPQEPSATQAWWLCRSGTAKFPEFLPIPNATSCGGHSPKSHSPKSHNPKSHSTKSHIPKSQERRSHQASWQP